MKISVQTLGCKVNQSESFSLEAMLRGKGHEVVGDKENPDICVINTCTVTAKSDYQSRQIIRRALRSGAKVIATGCYAQLRPEELSKIKGIALIIGNSHKDKLLEYIDNKQTNGSGPDLVIGQPDTPLSSKPYYSERARAFLKIQDGCNFSCTYCAVPMARGKSRSLEPIKVIRSVEKLTSAGYKEIVLTGIHIGSYGVDQNIKTSLYEIVEKILKSNPIPRIRLSSLEPNEFDDRFLDLIKDGALCSHLHIPLQSGSDNVLKKMNRGYDTSYFRRVVERIILKCPDISIGTDLIVGFPGESEQDFSKTLKFIDEMPLSYIHTFPYSKRADTAAESFPEHIDNNLKKDRVQKVMNIGKIKKNTYITGMLGKKLNVIVENKTVIGGYYRGISSNYIRPLLRGNDLIAGQRLSVLAVSMDNGELICEPI